MKLSIITITYNAESVLEKTIKNVLSQSYNNFEYIIVDGLSTDNTLAIISKYASRINQVISEKDTGIYDAMNKGLKVAKGDYVLFMNAGDSFQNELVLETIFKNSNNEDILYGETEMINASGKVLGLRRLRAPKKLTWKSFQRGMLVCHQSIFVKREIAPLYDLQYKISADINWIIECLKKAKTVKNTEMIIARFLIGGESKNRRLTGLKERFTISVNHYGFTSSLFYLIYIVIRFVIQVPFYRRLV